MFKRQIVKSCPVVKASRAVMRVPADLVREWNGLLRAERDCEWLALLTGTRSEDGLLVEIDGMIIPQNQERSVGMVKLPEGDEPDGVVGVIHSHHSMGAKFSGIDWSTLNNRFWSSIVISYALDSVTDNERWWMGFDYEAVAQFKLPCGSLGMVEMEVEVVGAPENTFIKKWPKKGTEELTPWVDDAGDCPNTKVEMIDEWRASWKMDCGLESADISPIQGALGETTSLLSELPPAKVWQPALTPKGKGDKGWTTVDERQSVAPISGLTRMEETEMDTLALIPYYDMTDAEFDRWCELEDKERGETRVDTPGACAAAQQGEKWVQEDAAWEAYQRTYFEMQMEAGDNV